MMRQRLGIGCVASLAFLSLFATASAARADYTTTVNPSVTWGTWQGWGCSLSWWANVFGTRDDIADVLFTTKSTVVNKQALPGLGLTIARYNAGGCTNVAINGASMQLSPNILAFKQIQAYWLNWNSADPASASWNWYADSNQRAMLWKARDRGANKFELFSVTPVWWMCLNSNPSGANNGNNDNLQPWNTEQHAVYLATIAKYAAVNWGFNFDSVEAFNEPNSNWWNSQGTQEGCHFAPAAQATVITALRTELNKRGLTAVKVAASDENTYDLATATWNSFNAVTQSKIGRVDVHGYEYNSNGGGPRTTLLNTVRPKEIWNSEYGEGDATGMTLATNLNMDIRYLNPTAWCYWQPLDSGGWGMIRSNPSDNWIGAANPKYFVMAQYTRHIRPGMTMLDSGDHNTTASYNPATHKLVLVTTNYGAGQWVNYDLSRYGTVSGPVTRWATDTSATGDKYTIHNDTHLSGKRFWSHFGPNTVQTFEVRNVY